jgi:hypothetical protein
MFLKFTDGIFIGVAWMGCGSEMAYTIALATILHELPNQLAGFFVMVNQNGIPPITALILNFIFGLSILLGGLLVLLFDFSDVTVGCLLAMGGGTFLHGKILYGTMPTQTKKYIPVVSYLITINCSFFFRRRRLLLCCV